MTKHEFISFGGSVYCAEIVDGAACRRVVTDPIHAADGQLTINDCTHGDGCPVHPDVHALHNFDDACFQVGEMCTTHDRHISRCRANTPAETRTGISNRAAAALADVAELRRRVVPFFADNGWLPERLDRIEAALREGGAS